MTPEIIQALSVAVAAIGLGLPAVWHLSTKIARLQGEMAAIRDLLKQVRGELKESRSARAQLWQEINSLRERVAKIETRAQL